MNGTETTTPSVAYCRACGKALTEDQQVRSQGTVYCAEHAPQQTPAPETPAAEKPAPNNATPNDFGASPWTAPPTAPPSARPQPGSASPGLAFLLGLIPGVGAIYNGQYAKGLTHVVIMGMLASIASSNDTGGMEFLLGMLLFVFPFYMAFEAYHTASRREKGQPVDEFSSLFPLHGGGTGSVPAGPVLLIGAGVIFLLHNLEILRIGRLMKFWPVLLIALGVYMIYARMSAPAAEKEPRHE